jgi:hypothetical protein
MNTQEYESKILITDFKNPFLSKLLQVLKRDDSISQSSCVSPVQLPDGRHGEERADREPKHRPQESLGP